MVKNRDWKLETVSIGNIEVNEWNPNKFEDFKFQELVKEVIAEGIDQPIICIRDKESGKYIVVDGEHRFRAAKAAGLKEIPIVVKENWDKDKAKIETVRRNALRGELDKAKFTDLVNSLAGSYKIDELVRNFAMTEEEFEKGYIMSESDKAAIVADVNITKEKALYEDVSYIVQKIMSDNKDNIEKGYVYFMYKGTYVLCLELDRDLKNKLVDLITSSEEKGKSLQRVLVERLLKGDKK